MNVTLAGKAPWKKEDRKFEICYEQQSTKACIVAAGIPENLIGGNNP
jgi:hypothetical protein